MKGLKITLWTLLIVFVCALVLIGFLPSIFSTKSGSSWLINRVNHQINGSISVEDLHLSWRGPQSASNVELKDKNGKVILKVDSLETGTSLMKLLLPWCHLSDTKVETPYLYLVKESEDELNVEKALSSSKKRSKTKKSRKKKRSQEAWKPPCYVGSFDISNGKIVFDTPQIQPVLVDNLNISYNSEEDVIKMQADTIQEGVKGEIFANGNLTNDLHVVADIKHFPVAVLDQLRGEKLFTLAIGETLDCTIDTRNNKGTLISDFKISSENLSGDLSFQYEDHALVLIHDGGVLNYTLTPAAFNALLGSEQQKQWKLARKTPIFMNVIEGVVPLNPQKWTLKELELRCAIEIEDAELVHNKFGFYKLKNLNILASIHYGFAIHMTGDHLGQTQGAFVVDIAGDTYDKMTYRFESKHFPFALLDLVMDETELARDFLGHLVNLQVDGVYEEGVSNTKITIDSPIIECEVNVKGSGKEELEFSVVGRRVLTDRWEQVLGSQITFQGVGHADIWDKNFAITTLNMQLANEIMKADITGSIGDKSRPFNCDQINLNVKGQLLRLPYGEHFDNTQLKKGTFILSLNGKENLIKGASKIQVTVNDAGGKIESKTSDLTFTVKDLMCGKSFDWKEATIDATANLQHFPTVIAALVLPGDFDLARLIGPILDAKAHAVYDPHNKDHLAIIDLDAQSSALEAHLSVAVDGNLTVNQPKPATFTYTINPARYDELLRLLFPGKSTDFDLASPATLDVSFTDFSCPAKKPDSLRSLVCQSGLVGSVKSSPIIYKKGQEVLAIEDLVVALRGENVSKALNFDLSAQTKGSASLTEPSRLLARGRLENLWDHDGTLQPGVFSVEGEVDAEYLPIRQILGMIPLKSETRANSRAILGDYLNSRITGEVKGGNGPVTVDLKTSNFKALLPLQFTPTAILLRDHVAAEITLTEEVSEVLLVDVNPLFITGANSEHPLRLYIDPKGFSFPINPFTFKGISIENGVLDIGEIQVRNGGQIQDLMDFLKAKEITDDKWMSAWFTPIFFSLKDGTSHYKRFDILLAKTVHIALWGKIDLVKSKVKMTLGIAPSTLAQRFSVTGLSKKDMFQVKMRGKTNDVELDWSSAYTRIGIIIARLTGGHLAYLVGGVLDQIITALGDETTPPPTTTPFPWEKAASPDTHSIPQEQPPKKTSLRKRAVKKLINFLLP